MTVGHGLLQVRPSATLFAPYAVLVQFDLASRDASYWQSVKRFLVWLSDGLEYRRGDWARDTYKKLKRQRLEVLAEIESVPRCPTGVAQLLANSEYTRPWPG